MTPDDLLSVVERLTPSGDLRWPAQRWPATWWRSWRWGWSLPSSWESAPCSWRSQSVYMSRWVPGQVYAYKKKNGEVFAVWARYAISLDPSLTRFTSVYYIHVLCGPCYCAVKKKTGKSHNTLNWPSVDLIAQLSFWSFFYFLPFHICIAYAWFKLLSPCFVLVTPGSMSPPGSNDTSCKPQCQSPLCFGHHNRQLGKFRRIG